MTTNVPARAFDRTTLSNTMQSSGGTGITFAPTDFNGLLEVANLMAASGQAVMKHLRQNPGMCLSIAMTGYQNGFNPFLLANDTYVVNDILAYGAKSLTAMVNNSPRLESRLLPIWSGQWPNRRCTVTGRIRGDNRDREIEIKAETITTRNSPLWKTQPDIQLAYYSQRAWARLYMPEVLLGLLDSDEAEEMRDITPQRERVARPTRAAAQKQEPASAPGNVIDGEFAPVEESAAGDPEAVAEQAEDAPYYLIDTDGVQTDFTDPSAWLNALYTAIKEATSEAFVDGLWESNSPQFQGYREAVAEGGKHLDWIEKAYIATKNKFSPRKAAAESKAEVPSPTPAPTPTAAPQQQGATNAAAPRSLGNLPKNDAGSFSASAAARILGDAIETSASLDDVVAWQKLNMDWIEWLSKNAAPMAAMVEKRIAAVREILSGAEA